MSAVSYAEVTWPAGGTASKSITLSGVTVCGFHIPAAFTGTSITFLVSDTGTDQGNFNTLTDDAGATISYTVSASKYARAKPADFAGVQCMKVVSGSSEAANRVVKIAVREIA